MATAKQLQRELKRMNKKWTKLSKLEDKLNDDIENNEIKLMVNKADLKETHETLVQLAADIYDKEEYLFKEFKIYSKG